MIKQSVNDDDPGLADTALDSLFVLLCHRIKYIEELNVQNPYFNRRIVSNGMTKIEKFRRCQYSKEACRAIIPLIKAFYDDKDLAKSLGMGTKWDRIKMLIHKGIIGKKVENPWNPFYQRKKVCIIVDLIEHLMRDDSF